MRQLLEGVPIFAGLSVEALELLMSEAQEHCFVEGAVIVNEGESSNRLYLIELGSVRVWKRLGCPDQVELATLGAKDFFGEMCILETLPRSASVQAKECSALVSISSLTFHRLYQKMPAQYSILVLNIARDLSRRLRRLDEMFAGRH